MGGWNKTFLEKRINSLWNLCFIDSLSASVVDRPYKQVDVSWTAFPPHVIDHNMEAKDQNTNLTTSGQTRFGS